MQHHRQQLDMGEAEVAHVGNELVGQLLPRERPPVRVRRQDGACTS